jgi:hypothetical protein
MATNTPQGLTEADRGFRQELEEREKLLLRDRSTDPKLEDLEKSLADRQARESHDLALKQTAELNRLGPSQQLTDSHRQEWEEQTKDFAKERERYIVEFYDAQRMVEEMRERDKPESLERGDERDHLRSGSRADAIGQSGRRIDAEGIIPVSGVR